MKIIRAQKQIKRLSGEIKELEKRAQKCLNTLKDNEEFSEELQPVLQDIANKEKEWVNFKARVLHTNVKHNMVYNILMLGRLKIRMDRVREMKPRIGAETADRYHIVEGSKNVYKSQLTLKEYQDMIKGIQNQINEITDILDDFNVKTDIIDLSAEINK